MPSMAVLCSSTIEFAASTSAVDWRSSRSISPVVHASACVAAPGLQLVRGRRPGLLLLRELGARRIDGRPEVGQRLGRLLETLFGGGLRRLGLPGQLGHFVLGG